MAQDCTKLETLHEAALLVIANAELLRDWVNGDETSSVTLGGKLTPTIRKLVADIDARESAAAREVINAGMAAMEAQIVRATAEADRARTEADRAKATIGTGQCPYVFVRPQNEAAPSGTVIPTPAYFPGAAGMHVYHEGLLLGCGQHYTEGTAGDDGRAGGITVLFDVDNNTVWEFHIWDSTGEPPVSAVSLTTVGVDEAQADEVGLTFHPSPDGAVLEESEMTFFPLAEDATANP